MSLKVYSKLITAEDQAKWDEFVENSPWTSLLQLWGWGEAKLAEGWTPFRVGIFEDQKLICAAQGLLKRSGLLGNYFYVPHGPVVHSIADLEKALPALTFHLTSLAKAHNCFVIEVEPLIAFPVEEVNIGGNLQHYASKEYLKILQDNGFRKTKRNIQPKYKLFYDLEQDEEQLLQMMKKNTRYNVRYAQKKGVEVNEYSCNIPEIFKILEKFYDLLLLTQIRAKGYPIRPLASFRALVDAFKNSTYLFFTEAKYEGDVVTINISQRTKFWASSFYAASNREHSNVKAPYLLRWFSVLAAKKAGCKVYDFWGIIPGSDEHKGYSDTKISFGGIRMDTVGLLALPINDKKFLIFDKILPWRTSLLELLRKVKNFSKKSS